MLVHTLSYACAYGVCIYAMVSHNYVIVFFSV